MSTQKSDTRVLAESIRKRDLVQLKNAIAAGARINKRDSEGTTLLMEAAAKRFPEGVSELLLAGADPQLKDINGWTVADYAVEAGSTEVLRILADKVPDGRSTRICLLKLELLESQHPRHDTLPVFEAARAGNAERIRELLSQGSGVDVRDELGMTALMYAAAHNHKAASEILLEESASTELRCLNDWYPLEHAAYSCSGASYEVIYAKSSKAVCDLTKDYVDKHKQAGSWRFERPDLNEQLLRQNLSQTLLDQLEKSASPFSGERTLDLLNRHGLPLSIINSKGQGPLFWAVMSNNLDMVLDCLAAGSSPDCTDYFGLSPLSYACQSESRFQVARVLWKRTSEELRQSVSNRIEDFGWDFS